MRLMRRNAAMCRHPAGTPAIITMVKRMTTDKNCSRFLKAQKSVKTNVPEIRADPMHN